MKRVLLVFETDWDRRHLATNAPWRADYLIDAPEPDDVDCPWDFDVPAFIEEMVRTHRDRIHGVFSSSDYPGATAAAAIASRLGLPGSTAEQVIACSHKYYSRLTQQGAVPEATPAFALVDPNDPQPAIDSMSFPCFIKPVKGAFSVMSGRMNTPDDLRAFLARPATKEFLDGYVHIFNDLVRDLTTLDIGGSYFLAEEFLRGTQVTVDGFVFQGSVEVLGIVDSTMYPGTHSFGRFDYPSALSPKVQARMESITERAVLACGLENTMFNVELIYDARGDRVHIVEINPRLCGQFADLYEKVDGVNGYAVALSVATGVRPRLVRGDGRYRVATSFPLRTFRPVRATQVPGNEDFVRVAERFPGTLIWWECSEGQELADFESLEDGHSFRYGVVNVGGDTRADTTHRLDAIRDQLGYRLEPLHGRG
jgi:biotin carboxylase